MTNAQDPPSQIALGDVLGQTYLGLRLVVGTNTDLKRPVSGAHAIEVANPSRWVSSNWIALTTGLRLKSRPQAQRELIQELKTNGITALGFGLGVNFNTTPKALIEEAVALEFPIFTVPYTTGFAEVIAFVNQSLASPHLNTLLRFVSMQDYLLSSLSEPTPLSSICSRMAQLLQVEVVILDPRYNVIASNQRSTSMDQHKEIAEAVRRQLQIELPHLESASSSQRKDKLGHHFRPWTADPADEFELEKVDDEVGAAEYVSAVIDFTTSNLAGTAISVGNRSAILGWLVTLDATKSGSSAHLRLPLLRSTAHLVAATLQQQQSRLRTTDTKRRSLMRELMTTSTQHNPTESHTALRRHSIESLLSLGIETESPGWTLYIEPEQLPIRGTLTMSELNQLATTIVSHLKSPYLIDLPPRGVTLYIQEESSEFETFVKTLAETNTYLIGISERYSGLRCILQMTREAEYCVSLLRENSSGPGLYGTQVRSFQELSLTEYVESYVPKDSLRQRRLRHLDPILNQSSLINTMRVLLDHNLDINSAAKELNIHPNSLRYRVQKVEAELGISLRNFHDCVELFLALRGRTTK